MPSIARQLLLVLLALTTSCAFEGSYAGTRFKCPTGECPAGFQCVAAVCQPSGASDAGPADAAPVSDAAPGSHAAIGPDAALTVCQRAALAAPSDRCSQAIALPGASSATGVTVYGDTTGYASDLAPTIPATCSGAFESGPDAVYTVSITAGQRITATLTTEGWDGALYILSACNSSATCVKGANSIGTGSEMVSVVPASAGTYHVVVDATAATSAGCYTLDVKVGP